jgi:DNA ligase-1
VLLGKIAEISEQVSATRSKKAKVSLIARLLREAHEEEIFLAAEWGHGRRRGWLSNLHLGARDPEANRFVMLGKTFKGLSDEMLRWQTKKLLALEIGRDTWTVYVKPEIVVEVAFSDLQESPRYPGGLALRFARVKRFREDKTARETDTIDKVRGIFEASRRRLSKRGLVES